MSISNKRLQQHQGVTLVELVMAIVIISIAALALLQSVGFQTRSNVDPVIQVQSQLLARQYLEEVMGKSFFDPSADPRLTPSLNQQQVVDSIADATRTGSPSRVAWDNINEYDNFSSNVSDINGTAISGMTSYRVDIDVDFSPGLALGTLTNSAIANCPAQIAAIVVTITDPRGRATDLSGYRTSYWQPPSSWGC